ncbi:hypothetical protein OSB04_023319 [Centaurea solstitialis]|uniref:ABC transporter B family member 29, chloroplastic n=1 Tax=Centaurea solstitialis TaxID=347529 RepID=A0AA38T2G1_9ASTR|nr:hypothetical protein OSB04_023319 [Centaurea solstitialis]
MILLIPPPSSLSSSSLLKIKRKKSNRLNLISTSNSPFPNLGNHHKPYKFNSISCSSIKLSTSLTSIKPYVQSEWKSILKGWICSAVSVYSLSRIVPKVGKFSALMNVETLRNEGLVIGVLFLVRLVSSYLQQSFLWEASLRSVYKMRVRVFERVLGRDLGFFEGGSGNSVGDVAYRITAEASDVADTIYALLNTIVPSSLQLLAMATQMLVISPVLSLVSALVIPLIALVSAYFGEELREVSNKANISIAAISAYLNEVLPSILFVKANNAEKSECMRFERLAHADLYGRLNKKRMKALVPQMVQATFYGVLLLIFIGSLVAGSDFIDFSGVVSFITSLVLLIEPIQELIATGEACKYKTDVGKAYNELKQGEPAIERLFQLSTFKPKVIEEINEVHVESVAGEVKFREVSFRYGDSQILIDNRDIRNISLESLRTHVGLVTQDTTLFSGTIAENIGYRDLMSKINIDRVMLAAQTANADEFIGALSEGYATNIGPRGSLLSGGQRQRLAIARALYQNPSILVLDEATSALDTRSEMLVRQALQRLMKNRTVIVIAHRLETVLMAERVFLLNDGKLQEISRSSLLVAQDDSLASSGLVI